MAAAVAVASAACARQRTEYLIAAAGPQQLSYGGTQNQRGIQLAVEEINRAGGINGVPLRLLVRNDHGSGVDAARVAAEFVANRDVIAVVGHTTSGAMVSAARVYDAGHLTAVATTPSSPDLTGISSWVFRMIPSDSISGILLARFASSLASRLGRPVRAAILYENDAYGRGLAESFRHNFRGDVISTDPVGAGGDLEPYVAYYKMKKPDVVFVASIEDIGIPFLHEARRQHLDAMFLGGDGWQGVTRDSVAEGVYVGVPFTTQSSDTATQRFITAFHERFGELPEAHAALAYDATRLVARAIATAGASRSSVREYLSSVTGAHAFQGVSGAIRFTELNDPVGDNFRITRVQHGLLVPVGTP